jgi:hypothetical protein
VIAMSSMMFPRNEGSVDRGLRVVAGLGVLALTFVGPQSLWGLIGLVLVVTGLIGHCPIYRLFGLSTATGQNKESRPHPV